jgi:hypothetical protein
MTIVNEMLQEINEFATSEKSVKMFPHRNIHKDSWTSLDGKTHSQIQHVLIDKRRQLSDVLEEPTVILTII